MSPGPSRPAAGEQDVDLTGVACGGTAAKPVGRIGCLLCCLRQPGLSNALTAMAAFSSFPWEGAWAASPSPGGRGSWRGGSDGVNNTASRPLAAQVAALTNAANLALPGSS